MTARLRGAARAGVGLACGIMAVAAARGLYAGYLFLLSAPEGERNLDILTIKRLTVAWFAGLPIYVMPEYSDFASFPPATYAIMWPFVGWGEPGTTRLLWAAVSVASVAFFTVAIVRASGVRSPSAVAFVALSVLSIGGTRVAIGNGQPVFLPLASFTGALLLLRNPDRGGREQAVAACLLLVSFLKPQLVVPLLWGVLLVPGAWRALAAACCGYAALTLLAAAFQAEGAATLVRQWVAMAAYTSSFIGDESGNTNNLYLWLTQAGLSVWRLPASAVVLLALGAWTYACRKADPWLLLGLGAVTGRLALYHRFYDDPMLAFTIVALVRQGSRASERWMRAAAWVALGALMCSLVALHAFRVFRWYEIDAAVLVGVLVLLGFATWRGAAAAALAVVAPANEEVVA